MSSPAQDETCWTLIGAVASGDGAARSRFAHTYLTVVRRYLGARWRDGDQARLDDAVQDVFFECFRPNGALERLGVGEKGHFRTYLYAVVRNVARRHEERFAARREQAENSKFGFSAIPSGEESLATVFDRAWAKQMLARAATRQRERAAAMGPEAIRRVEVLQMRFAEGKAIRDIADELGEEPALVHAEYRKARAEFKEALREEVRFNNPDADAAVDRECLELLRLFDA